MPLKLNVGVSRKVGLPDYGSAGASCNLELELSQELLESDLAGFQERVRNVYVAVRQAVQDELARLQAPSSGANGSAPTGDDRAEPFRRSDVNHGRWGPPSQAADGSPRSARAPKPATENQLKAIRAIARRQHADLDGLLQTEFAVERPEDLSLAQASRLIDQLKAAADA